MTAVTIALLVAAQSRNTATSARAYRWVMNGLRVAFREGDVTGYPGPGFFETAMKRADRFTYAWAVSGAEAERLLRLTAFLANPVNAEERAALVRGEELLPFYGRADREFDAEIRSFGEYAPGRLRKIEILTQRVITTSASKYLPFRDVPVGHWAAKAVGDLRALGLLDGYPYGRFRGSR